MFGLGFDFKTSVAGFWKGMGGTCCIAMLIAILRLCTDFQLDVVEKFVVVGGGGGGGKQWIKYSA